MQLHACLLLLLITTDKTWSQHICGGDVNLDQEPVGRIRLTLPDNNNNNTLDSMREGSDTTPSLCTWRIHTPRGRRTLLLKVEELDGGSSVSVRCLQNREDQEKVLVLERGGAALLSGCVGNKATLSWTGTAQPSHELQLSYYVHEDERNSSEEQTNPQSDGDVTRWPQTGTSFTSTAPANQETVSGTDGVRGQGHEDVKWAPTLRSLSGSSSEDQGLLHPTSPQQGLSAAGRGTLPLPEEAQHNGADTSGPAQHTDGAVSATQHACFQHTRRADTSNTQTYSSDEPRQTQATQTDAAAGSSSTLLGTGTHTPAVSRTPEHTTTHTPHTPSSSSVPELLSQTSWRTASSLVPHGGAVGGTRGEILSNSWRSQRSTSSDLTSGVTSDPSRSAPGPLLVDRSIASADGGTTESFTSSQAHLAESTGAAVSAMAAAAGSFHTNTSGTDSLEAAASEVSGRARAVFDDTAKPPRTPTSPNLPRSSPVGATHPPHTFTHTAESAHNTTDVNTHTSAKSASSSPVITKVDDLALSIAGSSLTPRAATAPRDVQDVSVATETTTQTNTLHPTATPMDPYESSTSLHPSAPPPTSAAESPTHPASSSIRTDVPSSPPSTITSTSSRATTNVPATHKHSHDYITTTHASLLPLTTARSDDGVSGTTAHTTTAGPTWPSPAWTSPHAGQGSKVALTPSAALTSAPTRTPATGLVPKFYIVPDRPATVRAESVELLLQIIVEQPGSASAAGLEEDTTAWVEPYLQKAPGFHRLLGVWSSGHAVQILVEFKTSGALQWLAMTGPSSLLERTGLSQAAGEGRGFRWSKVTSVTVGGLQGDVCDWLLLCPAGYKCVSQQATANYTCSSVCHFDYCHHHGICTHHPGQLPVCHCQVGEDFWYMGQRCDVKMTRARLVGSCLAVLVVVATVIGVLAFVAVRRYRAILIQAKVDQTRSSYRRFNHFDELSGRFWLRSSAGSADSMDNPAFTRSDELLHLRALDRPCCYHDDTLSVASTCPSHATHINTIYPHSSQYGWRGSEVSMGDGVLDSGKASDLSVCSWPVEPIHWTPFPLLQQLASHRTPTVRVSRPRSYCEGMELVDLGKSWTA